MIRDMLRQIKEEYGISYSDMAAILRISPQNLNNKIRLKTLRVIDLMEIAAYVGAEIQVVKQK